MRDKKTSASATSRQSPRWRQKLNLVLLLMVSLLGQPGLTQELPIMDGAIAAMSDIIGNSESAANQIAQTFKANMHTSTAASPFPDFSKWYQIMFPESLTIVTAQVVNQCTNLNNMQRMGNSYICATETSAEPNLATDCVPFTHPSGGW